MKTIIIDVEEGTNARRILEAVKLLKGVKSAMLTIDEGTPVPNAVTSKAMKDAETGKTFQSKSVDELFDSI